MQLKIKNEGGNKTRIADIIVPEVFNPYVIQRTTELSALAQAGIISNDLQLDALASAGGKQEKAPVRFIASNGIGDDINTEG